MTPPAEPIPATATGLPPMPMKQGAPFPLFALQGTPGADPLLAQEERVRQQEEEGETLLCRLCRHPITEQTAALTRDGSHLLTRNNPAGLVFTIGLFAAAPGCTVTGPPTLDYTWFAGYGWEVAACSKCLFHLGWRFSRHDADLFFGLIVAHLISGR